MKNLLMAGLTLFLAAPPVRADHAPCAPPSAGWVERTVTCYRPEWQERDVTCTVMRAIPRVVVEPRTCTIMVPEWSEQKRTVQTCRYVPQVVERDVTRCRMVPVTCTDPCTGCTYTACRPEYYTERVKCTVMQPVFEPKEVTVRVCTFKPEQRTFEHRRVVCEYKPETVTYKQRYCVMVPYQTKVMVPAPCH